MGYDAFWPLSLATINVLCVPARSISNARFEEIVTALRLVPRIRLNDLELDQFASDGQLNPAASTEGMIFYNYGRAISSTEIDRFPYETNAQPQVVLCVLDQLERKDNGQNNDLHDVERQFMARYEGYGAVCCTLLCLRSDLNDEKISSAAIFSESLQPASLYTAMLHVTQNLISTMNRVINDLSQGPLSNPRLMAAPAVSGRKPSASSVARSTSPSTPREELVDHGTSTTPEITDTERPPSNIQHWRQLIVSGSMNLQAGCWRSAMTNLAQGALQARNNRDVFWETCAIERLLLCMTLLAWTGSDFAIPEVCNPAKTILNPNPAARFHALNAVSDTIVQPHIEAARSGDRVSELFKSVPATIEMLLKMVDHIKANQRLAMPPVLISESRIRLLNFLIFANRVGSKPDDALEHFLQPQKNTEQIPDTSWTSPLTQTNISTMLVDSLPFAEQNLNSTNYVKTLIAVLNSFLSLGSSRKHAFYFRDLLQRLSTVLTHARKAGALEVGIHPSAAMSMIQDGNKDDSVSTLSGVRILLKAAATSFGIPLEGPASLQSTEHAKIERVLADLNSWTIAQQTGDILLKLEILRYCIGVCEALPDLESSLYFMSQLLRISKQVVTISSKTQNLPPMLSADEQMRLVEGVKKTSSASQRLGWGSIRGAYWDDFLVRNIEIAIPLSDSKLIPHSANELNIIDGSTSSGIRDPFIFNPFAKSTSAGSAPVIVAKELVTFTILLQNGLQADIDIEDIALWTEGCDFRPSHHSIVLGQMCSQSFNLTGIANETGDLRIRGCTARIRGCEGQDFFIFKQDWQALPVKKQKLRAALVKNSSQAGIDDSEKTKTEQQLPEPSILSVKVIDPQPIIETHDSSLEQPSIMLLEGQTKSFSWSVKNESDMVPADFILFTYNDNITAGLQDAMNRKDVLPVETYEMQYQIKYKPTIRANSSSTEGLPLELLPKRNKDFTFEIFGRPGLTNATIQLNFAHLGLPRSELKQTFYTRQRRFLINVTVNGSIEVPRSNIIPFNEDFVWNCRTRTNSEDERNGFFENVEDDYCLLVLDLRNVWPEPLTVTLSVDKDGNQVKSSDAFSHSKVTEEVLQPGYITRIVLPVPRIFVADPYAVIPNLGSQRQFVVSSSKLSLEAEAASRESFWYREELLKHLKGTWNDKASGKYGEIDLRKAIRLNSRMIDALKIDHVEISFRVDQVRNRSVPPRSDIVTQVGKNHYVLQTESFATLLISVHNRTSDRLRLLLRLQPALRDQPHNLALDLARRFIWSGVLQQSLNPAIEPGDTFVAELGIMGLSEGQYEVNATVEEIKGRKKPDSELNLDVAKLNPERRIWHARAPCRVDVVDGPL